MATAVEGDKVSRVTCDGRVRKKSPALLFLVLLEYVIRLTNVPRGSKRTRSSQLLDNLPSQICTGKAKERVKNLRQMDIVEIEGHHS
jgi:hypothetical protein